MDLTIIFCIFNRPDLTSQVFAAIKEAKPSQLIVIADGPRKNNEYDLENFSKCRDIIENGVDWDCELIKIYSDINLGCRQRISTGITTAFEYCDMAVIIEDDCLPSNDFFFFMKKMLDHYKDEEDVMHVSGYQDLQSNSIDINETYYFSRYPLIWGWGTWRRAWKHYDVNISWWSKEKDQLIGRLNVHKSVEKSIMKRFKRAFHGYDTWDYQWQATVLRFNGKCINPTLNLVENIGFDERATHTFGKSYKYNCKKNNFDRPISFNIKTQVNNELERKSLHSLIHPRTLLYKLKKLFCRICERPSSL